MLADVPEMHHAAKALFPLRSVQALNGEKRPFQLMVQPSHYTTKSTETVVQTGQYAILIVK